MFGMGMKFMAMGRIGKLSESHYRSPLHVLCRSVAVVNYKGVMSVASRKCSDCAVDVGV